jgi:hypothetical protein
MKRLLLMLALITAATFSAVDLVNMPENSWVQIPNTHLSSVAPSGWSADVIDPWGGAALDTKRNRLIVWGGGHNDYFGNELYAYEIDNERWVRLTNPTSNYATCSDNNSDGTPVSRHTYNGLAYIAHADRFFGIGGALACPPGMCGNANKTWTFDFATSTWQSRNPTGTLPGTCCGDLCAYDPATKKVFFGDAGAWSCGSSKYGLYSYDFTGNVWTKVTSDMFKGSMTVDTKRHVLLNLGRTSAYTNDYVTAFDLNLATPTRQIWTTTGADAYIQTSPVAVVYDPVADRYASWSGGPVWLLDPVSKAWSSKSATGAPPNNVLGVTNGVFGRWQYVPKVNAYIAVVGTGLNVYFYKLTPGLGAATEVTGSPKSTLLEIQAMPNPFRSITEISVTGSSALENLSVLDVQGKVVRDLTRDVNLGNKRTVRFDAKGLPAGLYILKAQSGDRSVVKRILVTR